jgi:hypothetical protein
MSVLITAKKKYYLIPDNILKKCKVTKKEFEKAGGKVMENASKQRMYCNLVDLRECCMSKGSYGVCCSKVGIRGS